MTDHDFILTEDEKCYLRDRGESVHDVIRDHKDRHKAMVRDVADAVRRAYEASHPEDDDDR